MRPPEAAPDALWAILLGYLQDFRSDDIVRTVSGAGLNVDWALNERDAYSHRTRIRAYVPRIQAAYDVLEPRGKAAVLTALAADLVRLHPRSDELQTAVARVEAPAPAAAAAPGQLAADHPQQEIIPQVTADPRRVFVVHGRDENLRAGLFQLLGAFGLQPIEWSEAIRLTGRGSPYIGEILDAAFGHAQAVVVLLSPDDEVRLAPDLQRPDDHDVERQYMMQPRPNVLFEAGMGFGRNPDRTILVEVGNVKAFSDVAGRHVVRLTNAEARRRDLAERLITAGCTVTLDGDGWIREGNFDAARVAQAQRFEPRRMEAPRPEPMTIRWVDLNYPRDSGLQADLERDGYVVRWTNDTRLARRLDIEGWSLVIGRVDDQSVVFKVRNEPEHQTLIKKRNILEAVEQ